jgi:arylsulfatase
MKEGRLAFALRRGGRLSLVETGEPLPAKATKIVAALGADDRATITADGVLVATGQCGGPLQRLPVDGLQVGQDAAGAVGSYTTPFAFGGKIAGVVLELQPESGHR